MGVTADLVTPSVPVVAPDMPQQPVPGQPRRDQVAADSLAAGHHGQLRKKVSLTAGLSDRELHFTDAGVGDAVVLIHGAGGSPTSNFPFLERLARRHRVIAPHLPGSGRSRLWEEPLRPRDLAEAIAAQLEVRGVSRYAVVGYSMGSAVAIELAACRPLAVTGVVVTAGFAKARPSLISLIETWDTLEQVGDRETLGRFIIAVARQTAYADAMCDRELRAAARHVAEGLAVGARAHLEMIRSLDVRSSLASTSQPLLFLPAVHDRLVDPAHTSDMREIRPDALTVPLDAGHSVGDEAGEAWLKTVSWFLSNAL